MRNKERQNAEKNVKGTQKEKQKGNVEWKKRLQSLA
jgi:hypothetical protein